MSEWHNAADKVPIHGRYVAVAGRERYVWGGPADKEITIRHGAHYGGNWVVIPSHDDYRFDVLAWSDVPQWLNDIEVPDE